MLKKITDDLALKAFVKTSGKTGIHIYVPIKRRLDYAALRAAAETIGKYLVQKHPEEITVDNTGSGFLSDGSVGHTGFTGTSIWMDPVRQVVVVVLANRVHPTRANERFAGVRRGVRDRVLLALDPGLQGAAAAAR